ncbi:MAG TPA: hypothetical protein VIQ31_05120 [Phormidium sp.]
MLDTKNIPLVNFSENFQLPGTGKVLMFRHETISAWVAEIMPQLKQLDPEKVMPIGKCSLELQLWKQRELLTCYTDKQDVFSFVAVDGETHIPILRTENGDVWMSLTPNEVATQRSGLRIANGNVLIGGMGLGWLAKRVLERLTVNQVTVVDINQDILNYFGKPLKQQYGDRLTLVHSDFYQYKHITSHNVVLVDIWETFGGAFQDRQFKEFKRRYSSKLKIWGWGDNEFRGFKDKSFEKMNYFEKLRLADLVVNLNGR